MSFFFGDGFDLYAAPADMATYWDTATTNGMTLGAGRFAGSRALGLASGTTTVLVKNSGSNDAVHHISIAAQITAATLTGSFIWTVLSLRDGATIQCSIVFRSDGVVLLTAGGPAGTVLATYTGAISLAQTWFAFEFEVVINNTTGSFAARKLGNVVNDFSATAINTRNGTANNYANALAIANGAAGSASMLNDDLLWRSDASSVAWVGDIRCYTRMPASDASVQWTPSGSVVPVFNYQETAASSSTLTATGRYLPFVAQCDGTIATLSLQCATAATASIKCSLFSSAAGAPTTVLGSGNLVTNPGIGTTTFTFATPVSVTQGMTYYAGFSESVVSGNFSSISSIPAYYLPLQNSTAYASFPVANPTGLSAGVAYKMTVNITPTTAANAPFVADVQQDAAASYVSSSTVGQTDLYGIAPISATPASVVGVTTRALAQKSDAGTRNIGVQLKSGATTSNGTSTALNTSFAWVWRNDLVDPATGAAWTATAVNNLQIGATVTA